MKKLFLLLFGLVMLTASSVSATVAPASDPALWVSPTGTLTNTIGNPVYSWADSGAQTYDLYVHPAANINAALVYLTNVNRTSLNCNNTTCSIDATTLQNGDAYWLANGDYSAWFKPANGDWAGPYNFTLNTPATGLVSGQETNTAAYPSRPVFHWNLAGAAENAAWFEVYAAPTDNLGVPVLNLWMNREQACTDNTSNICTPLSPADFVNGTYALYVRSWGPAGFSTGGAGGGYQLVDTFTIAQPTPGPITVLNVSGSNLTWTVDAPTAWVEVWIGTVSPLVTAYTGWHRVEDLGCFGGGMCSLPMPNSLTTGATYSWYVRSWGPGGFVTGGEDGWYAGMDFTKP